MDSELGRELESSSSASLLKDLMECLTDMEMSDEEYEKAPDGLRSFGSQENAFRAYPELLAELKTRHNDKLPKVWCKTFALSDGSSYAELAEDFAKALYHYVYGCAGLYRFLTFYVAMLKIDTENLSGQEKQDYEQNAKEMGEIVRSILQVQGLTLADLFSTDA